MNCHFGSSLAVKVHPQLCKGRAKLTLTYLPPKNEKVTVKVAVHPKEI